MNRVLVGCSIGQDLIVEKGFNKEGCHRILVGTMLLNNMRRLLLLPNTNGEILSMHFNLFED